MEIKFGQGTTQYGPGVEVNLTGSELAIAIEAYLVSHGVWISGPRTMKVNGELCQSAQVYVDPSGKVMTLNAHYEGNGAIRN